MTLKTKAMVFPVVIYGCVGIYSAFKCSFDEFVGEKVVSLSYSSTILGLSPSRLVLMGLLGEAGSLRVTPVMKDVV